MSTQPSCSGGGGATVKSAVSAAAWSSPEREPQPSADSAATHAGATHSRIAPDMTRVILSEVATHRTAPAHDQTRPTACGRPAYVGRRTHDGAARRMILVTV